MKAFSHSFISVVFMNIIIQQVGSIKVKLASQNSTLTRDEQHQTETAFDEQKVEMKQLKAVFRQVDNPHNPSSSTIKNNVQWKDQNGDLLNIGRGGKITKIGDVFYWVGHQPAPGPSLWARLIFSSCASSNLGSNSWELVRKIYEFGEHEDSTGNCKLFQHPDYDQKYLLFCKKLFFMETIDSYPIENAKFVRVAKPEDPAAAEFPGYHFGAGDVFHDGQHMYYITSRHKKGVKTSRTVLIYRMDSTWKKLEDLYTSFSWGHNKEGMHMVKNGDFYYLFASRTAGWKGSKTYYKKATSIKALANAPEKEVLFYPKENSPQIRSLGSQHRMIFEIEEGRWLFSGNRYPNESPIDWDLRFGRAVQAPVQFTSNGVEVYFKKEFDWKSYDYTSGDYDAHPRPNKVGYKSLFWKKSSVEDTKRDIDSLVYGGKAKLTYCPTTKTKMLKRLFGNGYATYTTNVDCSGTYSLHVSYVAPSDRYLHVKVNGGEKGIKFKFGRSGKVCSKGDSSLVRTIQLDLTQGTNVITFQNPPASKSPLVEWVSLVPMKCS
ncbi:predicted protein [Chaetoceros tenuissimus]|uniref:Uncharacterized protein n=1 Tax=Chaetoceros tenuissimus TaxID=426638 RepID=A0AAD3DCU4_9STRA|nr:predicted protein [Chaetoceros tenuissimus]